MQIRPAAEMPLTPRRSRRRRVVAVLLAAILALLAAVYTGWWFAAAGKLRDGALAWIGQRRAEGYRLDHGPPARTGFPLALGVRFPDAQASPPGADWGWRSAEALLTAPLIGRRTLTLALEGEQALALPGATPGRRDGLWTGGAESLSLALDPGDERPQVRLIARQLAMTADGGGDGFGVGGLELLASRPQAVDGEAAGRLTLQADGVRLPVGAAMPLGRDVSRIELAARLMEPIQPPLGPAALAAWREAGGVVEIDRLRLDYGAMSLEADGTLSLDRRGQPIGAFTTRITGWEAALDSLAAGQAIPAHTAAAAKILLRSLASGDGDRGAMLAAPLSLQDRTLSLGPVPLLRLPELTWFEPRSR